MEEGWIRADLDNLGSDTVRMMVAGGDPAAFITAKKIRGLMYTLTRDADGSTWWVPARWTGPADRHPHVLWEKEHGANG